MQHKTLKKHINLYSAINLAIGTILGTGILILPGLIYQTAGHAAIFSWLFDIALAIPLLLIFAMLGKTYPNAGGAAGFLQQAFPHLSKGFAYILFGAITTGLTAVALTGAAYIAQYCNETTRMFTAIIALLITSFIMLLNITGSSITKKFQNIIILLLLALLFFVIVRIMPDWRIPHFAMIKSSVTNVWQGMGIAFFAFSGWETVASTSAEYKNPKRDFPLAILISFIIISLLYLGLALSTQSINTHNQQAPLIPLLNAVFHSAFAKYLLIILILLLALTNLNGLFWSGSRLLYDMSNHGWTPKKFKLQTLSIKQHIPKRSILLIYLLCTLLFIFYGFNWISIKTLIELAGENCAIIYLLCILAFIKLNRSALKKYMAITTFMICCFFISTYTIHIIFPILLFTLPYLPIKKSFYTGTYNEF